MTSLEPSSNHFTSSSSSSTAQPSKFDMFQSKYDDQISNNSNNISTLFNNNISTSDVLLSDDLSMLPVIDDKTLLSSLKAKFEMWKYILWVHLFYSILYLLGFLASVKNWISLDLRPFRGSFYFHFFKGTSNQNLISHR